MFCGKEPQTRTSNRICMEEDAPREPPDDGMDRARRLSRKAREKERRALSALLEKAKAAHAEAQTGENKAAGASPES